MPFPYVNIANWANPFLTLSFKCIGTPTTRLDSALIRFQKTLRQQTSAMLLNAPGARSISRLSAVSFLGSRSGHISWFGKILLSRVSFHVRAMSAISSISIDSCRRRLLILRQADKYKISRIWLPNSRRKLQCLRSKNMTTPGSRYVSQSL